MRSGIRVFNPACDADWLQLASIINLNIPNPLLTELLSNARAAGALSVLIEPNYTDRDFSAAYTSFYATLFRPYRKQCIRAHFFSADLSALQGLSNTTEQVAALEAVAESYVGNIVIRPLPHAPISSAHISVHSVQNREHSDVDVRSTFRFHVMGVELSVEAMPLAQQDTRTGACAQAAIWMAGRHFHSRHRGPWFSMPEITSIALNPSDQHISRSLPAGSDFLTPDNMVRALKTMGRHPVMYAPDATPAGLAWSTVNPSEVVGRYINSGIPVILGLQNAASAIGHGVVAVGSERSTNAALTQSPNAISKDSDFVSHFLVNDDQRGAYCRLPIEEDPNSGYPFCFKRDLRFLIVPLPAKVFVTAEIAELISKDVLRNISNQRVALGGNATGSAWDVDAKFYDDLLNDKLVTRTYLTYGWKYKARALRNGASTRLSNELIHSEFPRYVWVTEIMEPSAAASDDPCERQIRGHSVIDATGSKFWESVLVADLPGLSVFWHFNPDQPLSPVTVEVKADNIADSYFPKIRGSIDYGICAAPTT